MVVVAAVKAASTDVAELTVTVHVPVPPHPPPLQPLNVEPVAGTAVSVAVVPAVTDVAQTDPQLMPAGVLVTVPAPVPDLVTVRMSDGGGVGEVENVAVTVTAMFPEVTQAAVPEQPPPLQPTNAEPDPGAAVSVTSAPAPKLSKQSAPQLMPIGLLTTVPAPVPALATVTSNALVTAAHASFEYAELPAAFDARTR
jgi:hypothetical protein